MSAIEVKIMLEQATRAPVEKLGAGDLNRLAILLRTTLAKLQVITEKEALLKIENSIAPEDKELFRLWQKAEKKSTGDLALATRRAHEKCQALIPGLRDTLRRVRQSPPEQALMIVDELPKEEQTWLSLLANVSDSAGKLIKYSPRTRSAWFAGIGVKVSGFEHAKRRKAR